MRCNILYAQSKIQQVLCLRNGGIFLGNNTLSTARHVTLFKRNCSQTSLELKDEAMPAMPKEIQMMYLYKWRQAYLLGLTDKYDDFQGMWDKRVAEINGSESISHSNPEISRSLKK
jgi:hypothetical protein